MSRSTLSTLCSMALMLSFVSNSICFYLGTHQPPQLGGCTRLTTLATFSEGGQAPRCTTLRGGGSALTMSADIEEKQKVMDALRKLLSSISSGDWATYKGLCDEDLTCFEPESVGNVVKGLDFHKFYFDMGSPFASCATTLCDVDVRFLAENKVAVVCYSRLTQAVVENKPKTLKACESRVFNKNAEGEWICVHFHRTPA